MIVIIDGIRGGTLNYNRGADRVFNIVILEDDGTVRDLTGHTVTAQLYLNTDRSDTPVTLAASAVSTTGATLTVAETDWTTSVLGARDYNLWIEDNDGSNAIEYGKERHILAAK